MYYLISNKTNTVLGKYHSFKAAEEAATKRNLAAIDFVITEDLPVKYVSRVTHVNGICIYNNVQFWTTAKPLESDDDTVIIDILGQTVTPERFNIELISNVNRIGQIDGRPGQIEYNMEVGNEFISLFREECILTEFNNRSNTSPMIIFQKLEQVIGMVQIGAFREAKQFLEYYREKIKDDFLTDERIDKYIAMLDAADSIEYATSEDEFVYHAPEEPEEETTEE